jgi:hypothetical protein
MRGSNQSALQKCPHCAAGHLFLKLRARSKYSFMIINTKIIPSSLRA